MYVFHYPYLARGFHAPAFLFDRADTGVHAFLTRCRDAVVADSVPLTDAVAQDVARQYSSGALSDTMVDRSEIRIVRKRRRAGSAAEGAAPRRVAGEGGTRP